MKDIAQLIAIANGCRPAELVLKNAQVFNGFTGQFTFGDIAISHGYIAGVGSYQGETEVDLSGKIITPGFIDGHVHLESSMVSPRQFARAVVPSGTTTVIIDPHEIANVSGCSGIEYMLAATEGLPMNVFVMLPSCVPVSELENAGAELTAAALAQFIHHPRVLGLGELMNYPGVLQGDASVLDKIRLAEGKIIDGHAPGLAGKALMAYAAAGIQSDHECVTPAEAIARLEAGLHVMLREGSAAKNLLDLMPAVNPYTAHRCFFVTDDRHPGDLIHLGHINSMVKLAVDAGYDVATVLQLATINAACYFGLNELGAIAPGYKADLLVFDDLVSWRPCMVWQNGKMVAKDGKALFEGEGSVNAAVQSSLRLGMVDPGQLRIPAHADQARVIGLIPRQIITEELHLSVPVIQGEFIADPSQDILKLAVFERHSNSGKVGVGLVKGFGLKSGAIASTIAHDSHNLIAIGTCDQDILTAVHELQRIQGGITIIDQGNVLKSLPLPLAGLMSDQDIHVVEAELTILKKLARKLGVYEAFDPFLTLAFLSLPVIPSLKLTDLGLVDVKQFKVVPVSVS